MNTLRSTGLLLKCSSYSGIKRNDGENGKLEACLARQKKLSPFGIRMADMLKKAS